MGRYSREPDNATKSCKARGPNLRVHFKVSYPVIPPDLRRTPKLSIMLLLLHAKCGYVKCVCVFVCNIKSVKCLPNKLQYFAFALLLKKLIGTSSS